MNVLLWQVSKAVPEMAVSGAAGGVKFAVYTAVPFTTLTFDKTPLTKPAVEPYPPPTLMVLDVLIKFVLLDKVLPTCTPLTKTLIELPDLVTAT